MQGLWFGTSKNRFTRDLVQLFLALHSLKTIPFAHRSRVTVMLVALRQLLGLRISSSGKDWPRLFLAQLMQARILPIATVSKDIVLMGWQLVDRLGLVRAWPSLVLGDIQAIPIANAILLTQVHSPGTQLIIHGARHARSHPVLTMPRAHLLANVARVTLVS